MDTIVKKTLSVIQRNDLILPGDAVFVALSGGADSVCLLHILLTLRDQLQYRSISALHLHHGIRKSADRDEQFVQELCHRLKIPLVCKHVDVMRQAKTDHETLEEAGRKARYDFFAEETVGVENAKIATAHHADDQAETILFNMVRGCGVKGIAGIPIKRENIIRPLIDCRAAEIREYCEVMGFSYIFDETNASDQFTRNKIRHRLLPMLESIHAGATQNLLRLSSIAAEEDQYLDEIALNAYNESVLTNQHTLRVSRLKRESDVIIKRVLRIFLQRSNIGTIEHRHLSELMHILHCDGRCNLPKNFIAECRGDTLRLISETAIRAPKNQRLAFMTLEKPLIFDNTIYIVEKISNNCDMDFTNVHKNLSNLFVSYDTIKGDVLIRTRREGDAFRPQRRHCTKSLKKWFNEQRIPAETRDQIPLLCDEDGILAVIGYDIDERAVVTPNTHEILHIKIVKISL